MTSRMGIPYWMFITRIVKDKVKRSPGSQNDADRGSLLSDESLIMASSVVVASSLEQNDDCFSWSVNLLKVDQSTLLLSRKIRH